MKGADYICGNFIALSDIEKKTVKETNFNLPGQTGKYNGKVRDVYFLENDMMAMVVTDRISAFDHILPRAIPFKGQMLNGIAAYNLQATEDIVPNWMLSMPDPNVMIGKKCEPYKVEMVIRGFLTGHAWRTYKTGERILCGVEMPDGMKENDPFPKPIITPTTKEDVGHDEDISREEILKQDLVGEAEYEKLAQYTQQLFERGSNLAFEKGLVLVDTKYEFGKLGDTIYLIDEIHTPDSSRFFYRGGYQERQDKGEKQKQLSKEFVREWLMENDFQGKEDQQMPHMPDEFILSVSKRYAELYNFLMDEEIKFETSATSINERIEQNIIKALATL